MNTTVRRLVTVTMVTASMMLVTTGVNGQSRSGSVHRSGGTSTATNQTVVTKEEGRRPNNNAGNSSWNNINNNNRHGGNVRPSSTGGNVRPSSTGGVRPVRTTTGSVRRTTNGRVIPTSRNVYPAWTRYGRPVPPPSYRPVRTLPVISSVCGVAFGTYINASVTYWRSHGYSYDIYDGEAILYNVTQMGYNWPNVYMNYDNYGRMVDAQFQYTTSGYNRNRFYNVRRSLQNRYGVPVSISSDSYGTQYTWYGGDGRGFVSLEFVYENGRSITLLSYGY